MRLFMVMGGQCLSLKVIRGPQSPPHFLLPVRHEANKLCFTQGLETHRSDHGLDT